MGIVLLSNTTRKADKADVATENGIAQYLLYALISQAELRLYMDNQ